MLITGKSDTRNPFTTLLAVFDFLVTMLKQTPQTILISFCFVDPTVLHMLHGTYMLCDDLQ